MPHMPRFPALDGWRALSILLVIAGHLFPLGFKEYRGNEVIAALGMVIFFVLSGFLITTTLIYRPSVREFLIRRICRIVPLAWLFGLIALTVAQAPVSYYAAQLLFYSNLPPFWLTEYNGHMWSLGAEMQFYFGIALVFLAFGKRGLWVIPVLCLLVTAHRIQQHELLSIVTSVRLDEILAGGTLALAYDSPRLAPVRKFLTWVSPLLLLPLTVISCDILAGPFCYLRPYLAAAMVGSTLCYVRKPAATRILENKHLAYIAAISYALYLLHPMVEWGWLGTGSKIVVYAKRIPALLAIWGLAHLSTFYYEDFWIRKGKEWCRSLSAKAGAPIGGDNGGSKKLPSTT